MLLVLLFNRLRQGQSEHSLLNKNYSKYPNHESGVSSTGVGQTEEQTTAPDRNRTKATKRTTATTQSQKSPRLSTDSSKSNLKQFPAGNPPKYSEIGSDGKASPTVSRKRSDMGSSTSIPQSAVVAGANSDWRRAMWRRSRSLPNSLVKIAGSRKPEEAKGRREVGNSFGVLCLEQRRLLPVTRVSANSFSHLSSLPPDAKNASREKTRSDMEETTIQIETTL